MSIKILLATVVGSLVTATVVFFVSRHRYRSFLTARAAVGGTITDAGLLDTLRAIAQAVAITGACATVGAAVLVVAGPLLNPLQVTITCGVILLLAAVTAWVCGRYAVLAELARTRHLRLPYPLWGAFLANSHSDRAPVHPPSR